MTYCVLKANGYMQYAAQSTAHDREMNETNKDKKPSCR